MSTYKVFEAEIENRNDALYVVTRVILVEPTDAGIPKRRQLYSPKEYGPYSAESDALNAKQEFESRGSVLANLPK